MTRRSFAIALVAAAGPLMSACLSPTLPPLPPPDAPSGLDYVGDGQLLIQGVVPVSEARVLIVNHDTSKISGQLTSDGHYSVQIAVAPGDYLELWYEEGDQSSSPRGFQAPLPGMSGTHAEAGGADASAAPGGSDGSTAASDGAVVTPDANGLDGGR